MRAEVIAIGDELTSGERLDTNSQWLSQRLGDLGITVLFHTTVADDVAANATAFRLAIERADVIIASGGLGPTADDLTRHAIAEATGTELVLDESVLAQIRALFARRKRDMPERNIIQAHFPRGSLAIPNPHGSAPGIDMSVPRSGQSPTRIIALPGVPAEMREMYQQTVEPLLVEMLGRRRRVIRHHRIKCFGVGESDLEQMLPDLIRRGQRPSVGITVSRATITLRITADGDSPEQCQAVMEPTIRVIRECLGDLIFGEGDDELQHVVARLLAEQNQSLSLVEWGTGGLVSHWLSEAGLAQDHFPGGIVVRDFRMLCRTLGWSDREARELVLESGEWVAAMAEEARTRMATDLALAIGPFPQFDSASAAPGVLHFALATASGVRTDNSYFAGHPEILKARSAKQALNLLRLHLLTPSR